MASQHIKMRVLDKQSVKVWWRYVIKNANAVNFCNILPSCQKKSKNLFTLGSTRIIHIQYFLQIIHAST